MDPSFIARLFALEAEAMRTYYVVDGTEHAAVLAEIDRMCPLPGLDLMVYRREGPLDELELSISSRNYKVEERYAFMTEFYEVDDRTQFLAVYTTSRNPLDVLFTLNELLWFKAVDDVVVELVAHAAVDVSKPDHLRKWVYMAGEAPLDQEVVAPSHSERGERIPMDTWGQGIYSSSALPTSEADVPAPEPVAHTSIPSVPSPFPLPNSAAMIDTFLQTFPPSVGNLRWTPEQCATYQEVVPPEVMEIWQRGGIGSYANGLFQVVDPARYEEGIYPYIFRDPKKRYVPFMLTAFGSLYFVRQLNNPATPDFTHDVQFLNIHTGSVYHVTFDVAAFLNTHLVSSDAQENELQHSDLQKALAAGIAAPGPDQMLCHTPAMALGGDGNPANCTVGDAVVHWDILRQMSGR